MKEDAVFNRICGSCGQGFTRVDNKSRHEATCTGHFEGTCSLCGHIFTNRHNLSRHEQNCALPPPAKRTKREPKTNELLSMAPNLDDITEYETAFNGRLKSFFIRSDINADLTSFLFSIRTKIHDRLRTTVLTDGPIKFNVTVDIQLDNQLGEETEASLKTTNTAILLETNIDDKLDKLTTKLLNELDNLETKKSGWRLRAIDGLRLKINKYNPLRASTFIELPTHIKNKKACINVHNTDEYCFKYSILAKLVHTNPQNVNSYTTLQHTYDFTCITFPTPLTDIHKFEKHNNISINVFALDDKGRLYPLKVTDNELTDHRDLLLISDDTTETNHYVYIKDFEKLVHAQLTSYHGRLIICKRCFKHYYEDNDGLERMIQHKQDCNRNKTVRIDMPTDTHLEFKNVAKSLRIPFVFYCDFESLLIPYQGCTNDPTKRYTNKYQLHEEMSCCAYLKISDEIINSGIVQQFDLPTRPMLYRGKKAALTLLKYLKDVAKKISNIYRLNRPMTPLTEDERLHFEQTTTCYMCDKTFEPTDIKVRDHCHITGRFRGAAHNNCNLLYKPPNFLPVMFHNLTGYDSHFLIKSLDYDKQPIDIIPTSEEKYIMFSKQVNKHIKLRFLDTFRFMPNSLDSLVKNLPIFSEITKFYPAEYHHLLTRKGVFCYDYLTGWDKLDETSLPPKQHFYNKLNKTNITDEDYLHAQQVWDTFSCNNLGEYSDHYLKTDTLLLADVFERFRDVTIKTHKLDPAQYFTLPGLTWDAMLRFTGVRLQLLHDYDQLLFLERGIRGGICQVSKRLCVANNKHIPSYDPLKPTTYITYQDCNNLYGFAMSRALPYDDFTWVENLSEINLNLLDDTSEYGYILDVDVHYPHNLHKTHNDLPFLSETININGHPKLVPHLNDRKNYIVHYITLKQALDHGLILTKINKALKFKQTQWLKPYIDHNTTLRTHATNNFEKDLYKLYNNAVYGKTMENIRKRQNIQLVCNAKTLEKYISRPEFIDRTIYSENLAAIKLRKSSIVFDKPIYVGMTILDLSKHKMYSYHYDVMLPRYDDRLELAYMDTDSFIYEIQTENLYDDMRLMLHHLDTSDYPKTHDLYSSQNRKVLGKFKDEAQGKPICKFVGLRPKMYSLRILDHTDITKAKGVQTASLRHKQIDITDYENSLLRDETSRITMTTIQSRQHTLYTLDINKIALCPHDDKRTIQSDHIHTLAIGFNCDVD